MRFLYSALLILSSTILGAFLGGMYARFFMPKVGMGWDQIADTLGALMIGGLMGCCGGIFLYFCRRNHLTYLRNLSLGVLVANIVVFGALLLLREPKQFSNSLLENGKTREEFSPRYKVSIRVGHSEDVLRTVKPENRPIPFTEARIFTTTPELSVKGWGLEFSLCKIAPSNEQMTALLPFVRDLEVEGRKGSCFTRKEDELGIPYSVQINGAPLSKGTVQGECLKERRALLVLAEEIGKLAAALCLAETR